MIKVAVWGPGSMGVAALRCVIDHPELELVGVVVHSEAKAGLDAGFLCGTDPVGVLATTDADIILSGEADVVLYAATGNLRPLEAIADMARILRAGKDVVSCSVIQLVSPRSAEHAFTGPLEQACRMGQSSCFTSGIAPGFAFDVLPLVLSGLARNIDSVRVTEIFNYGTYPDPVGVYDLLGFGQPPEMEAFAATPGVLTYGWGPVVTAIADALGVTIDNMTESVERLTTEHGFDAPNGRVEAGTVAAMRSILTGHVNGIPKITVDYVTRMHDDMAPTWPQPHITIMPKDHGTPGVSGQGTYRIELEGSPTIRCELEMAEGHDHDLGARTAGAAFLVNAIPAVVSAPPGLLGAADLPLVTGAGLVRPVAGPSPDSRRVGLQSMTVGRYAN
jgi:2,4-diaminopentanoate dehydrogenase